MSSVLTIDDLTKEQRLLLPFTDGITCLEGRKGTGKTSLAVAILKNLVDLFGMPAVCDFPLKEAFGPYTQIDIPMFVNELRVISEATKREPKFVAERAIDKLLESRYSFTIGSAMLLDEAYKYVESRTPGDRIVRLFGYWISQIRHYKVGLIMIVPHVDMVDKRVVRQIDRIGRCFTSSRDGVVVGLVNDVLEGKPLRISVDAWKYWEMFDSWVITPFRASHLRVGGEGEPSEGS